MPVYSMRKKTQEVVAESRREQGMETNLCCVNAKNSLSKKAALKERHSEPKEDWGAQPSKQRGSPGPLQRCVLVTLLGWEWESGRRKCPWVEMGVGLLSPGFQQILPETSLSGAVHTVTPGVQFTLSAFQIPLQAGEK